MHLHEYQAKQLLHKKGLPIPDFAVASSEKEVERILEEMDWKEAVLKIQVHAGGRGKAGGVKIAQGKKEILKTFSSLINMKLVNNQTGKEGIVAKQVLLTKPIDIKKEMYISFFIDRKKGLPTLMACKSGGMEIEEVSQKNPEAILQIPFSIEGELYSYHLLELCKFMEWEGKQKEMGTKIFIELASFFMETEASLLEINPFVEDKEGLFWLLDAKLTIDENALFRHKELAEYYDPSQLTKREAEAKEFDLSYVAMEGEIGCMVNGAGLAMATMDMIELYGGTPANFLDVGGGASKDKIAEGFRIIVSDPNVKAIFVHIFGGIMDCELLAEGILHAAKQLKVSIPIVVRMKGTHSEKGAKLLESSSLPIHSAKTLEEAAEKVVQLGKHGNLGK